MNSIRSSLRLGIATLALLGSLVALADLGPIPVRAEEQGHTDHAMDGVGHSDHQGDSAGTASGEGGERKILYWVAPMDPSFTSPTPGKSPMGMDLVPVYADEIGTASEVHDRAIVTIDARRLQLLGVRTTPVQVTEAVRTIRTVGFVEPDENRIAHVHTRLAGWLERVHVQAQGDPVRKGQVLYELYSPTLVATQEELLAAIRNGNRRAAAAARERLRYFDVAPRDIAAIERSGHVWRRVPFRSPIDGYVRELKAVQGMHVEAMTDLYVLVDLDRVWVIGAFYETDLSLLRVGEPAEVRFPDGDRRSGEVEYIYPEVDVASRFARVRLVFANEDLRLLPGMYVDVAYKAHLGEALVIPRDAAIRTGTRAIAFVALGNGRFEPRELDLGPPVDDGYVVYDGLEDGELVAEQANFFIDSESALKAALSKFAGSGHHQH